MNLLDFLIFLPVVFFGYRGFVNGIIKEVLSIVGIILAVFFTFKYMDEVSPLIRPFFTEDAGYIPFISGALIFIGTLVVIHTIAFLSKKFLEAINLNFINRLSGLAFGGLKSGIVVSAVLLFLAGFNLPAQETREESLMYSYIIHLAPWAYNTVAALYPGADNFSDTTRKTLDQYNPIQNFPISN